MPADVKDVFGHAIDLAQAGGKHQDSKAMTGFGSAGVLEVVEDHQGDTYRAVYTVKFAGWVYVLHCFQKKVARMSMPTLVTPTRPRWLANPSWPVRLRARSRHAA